MKKTPAAAAADYIDGLKRVYAEYGGEALCKSLETVAHGASVEDYGDGLE